MTTDPAPLAPASPPAAAPAVAPTAAGLAALGAEIGIKVVAEGVERREEVEALRATGLRFMQGFYFSRPVFEGLASPHDTLARMNVISSAHVAE